MVFLSALTNLKIGLVFLNYLAGLLTVQNYETTSFEIKDEYCFSNVRRDYDPEDQISVAKFDYFFDIMCRHVAGKRKWNPKKMCRETIGNSITITDEAFVILCFENYYDVWLKGKKNGKTKWTDIRSGNLLYKGWSDQGVERFYELCKAIEDERDSEKGKKSEHDFLDRMRNKYLDEQSKKRQMSDEEDENLGAKKVRYFDELDKIAHV